MIDRAEDTITFEVDLDDILSQSEERVVLGGNDRPCKRGRMYIFDFTVDAKKADDCDFVWADRQTSKKEEDNKEANNLPEE